MEPDRTEKGRAQAKAWDVAVAARDVVRVAAAVKVAEWAKDRGAEPGKARAAEWARVRDKAKAMPETNDPIQPSRARPQFKCLIFPT
jgi:hypothetical protein